MPVLTRIRRRQTIRMRFFFDERKATQAAAFLLGLHQEPMSHLRLIKLLYLADRQSLIEIASTITGDRFLSMAHGPVLSRCLDLIQKPLRGEPSYWNEHIERDGVRTVALLADPGWESLSEYETTILERVFERYRSETDWQIVDHTHALPEWEDPGRSARPIDPAQILRFAGYSEREVALAIEDAEAVYGFHAAMARIQAAAHTSPQTPEGVKAAIAATT